jgi:hypothetical protein
MFSQRLLAVALVTSLFMAMNVRALRQSQAAEQPEEELHLVRTAA